VGFSRSRKQQFLGGIGFGRSRKQVRSVKMSEDYGQNVDVLLWQGFYLCG
jgi:hypothetical protein